MKNYLPLLGLAALTACDTKPEPVQTGGATAGKAVVEELCRTNMQATMQATFQYANSKDACGEDANCVEALKNGPQGDAVRDGLTKQKAACGDPLDSQNTASATNCNDIFTRSTLIDSQHNAAALGILPAKPEDESPAVYLMSAFLDERAEELGCK